MSKIIKHQTVLRAVPDSEQPFEGMIVYRQVYDEETDRDEALALTEDVALDLGNVVTITVELGDRLNQVFSCVHCDGLEGHRPNCSENTPW